MAISRMALNKTNNVNNAFMQELLESRGEQQKFFNQGYERNAATGRIIKTGITKRKRYTPRSRPPNTKPAPRPVGCPPCNPCTPSGNMPSLRSRKRKMRKARKTRKN